MVVHWKSSEANVNTNDHLSIQCSMISIGREAVPSIISPLTTSDCPHLVDVPDVAGVTAVTQLRVQVIELEVGAPGVRGVGRVRGRTAVVGGVAPT